MELHTAETEKVGKDLVTKGLVFCAIELGFFLFPEEPLQNLNQGKSWPHFYLRYRRLVAV